MKRTYLANVKKMFGDMDILNGASSYPNGNKGLSYLYIDQKIYQSAIIKQPIESVPGEPYIVDELIDDIAKTGADKEEIREMLYKLMNGGIIYAKDQDGKLLKYSLDALSDNPTKYYTSKGALAEVIDLTPEGRGLRGAGSHPVNRDASVD